MKQKLILSLPLLIAFLLPTKIVQGQNFLKITQNSDREICIPVTLMDTIIHDLQERKLIMGKDSVYKGYISALNKKLSTTNTKYNQTEISLLKSEKKRIRNGWQRNTFILLSVVMGILTFR